MLFVFWCCLARKSAFGEILGHRVTQDDSHIHDSFTPVETLVTKAEIETWLTFLKTTCVNSKSQRADNKLISVQKVIAQHVRLKRIRLKRICISPEYTKSTVNPSQYLYFTWLKRVSNKHVSIFAFHLTVYNVATISAFCYLHFTWLRVNNKHISISAFHLSTTCQQ